MGSGLGSLGAFCLGLPSLAGFVLVYLLSLFSVSPLLITESTLTSSDSLTSLFLAIYSGSVLISYTVGVFDLATVY